MLKFIGSKVLYVLCVFLALRVWLYREYFAIHGKSRLSHVVMAVFMLFIIYIILTLKHAWRKKQMVTYGPYRFVAHPTYVMYAILDLPLWFLMPLSTFAVSTGILLYVVILITAYLEEKSLIRCFGDTARNYYDRTLSIHLLLSRVGIRG